MASFEQIYKEITDAFVKDEITIAKYGLDKNKTFDEQFSKYAIERIIFYTTAFVMYTREKALDRWLEKVEQTAEATRYGTKQWWHKMVLKWQKGYQIEVDSEGMMDYGIENESAKIIKYAAIVPDGRTVYVRVAKEDGDNLQRLSNEELSEFATYLDNIKPLGIKVQGQSLNACELSITMKVYYYGEHEQSKVESAVKTAIEEYLKNITFGGVVFRNKIIDAVQGVEGVSDVEVKQNTDSDDITYSDNGRTGMLGRVLQARSGYYKVSSWNITLTAENMKG